MSKMSQKFDAETREKSSVLDKLKSHEQQIDMVIATIWSTSFGTASVPDA